MIEHHVLVTLFDAPGSLDDGACVATQALTKSERHRQRERYTKTAEKGDLDDHASIHHAFELESRERQGHCQTRCQRKQYVAFHYPPIDVLKVFTYASVAHCAFACDVFEYHVFPLREQATTDDPIAKQQLHVACNREIFIARPMQQERQHAANEPRADCDQIALTWKGTPNRRHRKSAQQQLAHHDLRDPDRAQIG